MSPEELAQAERDWQQAQQRARVRDAYYLLCIQWQEKWATKLLTALNKRYEHQKRFPYSLLCINRRGRVYLNESECDEVMAYVQGQADALAEKDAEIARLKETLVEYQRKIDLQGQLLDGQAEVIRKRTGVCMCLPATEFEPINKQLCDLHRYER